MKKTIFLWSAVAFALLTTTVYGAGVTVPTSTTITEKAPAVNPVGAVSNGANINFDLTSYDYTQVLDLRLAKIHWVVDETFYATGYKSLLSKEVSNIFVPPDYREVI